MDTQKQEMNTKSKLSLNALLDKFLDGTCNGAEKQQLFDLIPNSENENSIKEKLYNQLIGLEDDKVYADGSDDKDRIFGNILNSIKHNELIESELADFAKKTRLRKILTYGASLAAVFMIAFLFGNFFGFFAKKINSVSQIEYTYNEIKAPFGSKSEIKLPDGTMVMLNAGSTLRYRNDFNLNNRDLILIGEALFTVARNIDMPLIVNAGNIDIRALGTEFNVKAYEDEGIIETTLIEGKVEISQRDLKVDNEQQLYLTPNQKAIYFKETDSFTLEKVTSADSIVVAPVNSIYENFLIAPKVNVTEVVAWTQGKLIIRGESLDDLCVELQRKYNVTFSFKSEEIKKYRFSGILLDETLEQVLNVIKLTAPIEYSLKGKTVYLSSDRELLDSYSKHLK